MVFETQLVAGRLVKRYKRFLADVLLENGEIVKVHCTNSGTMKSCLEPNARVMLSPAADPNRKTKYTWEMIEIDDQWVGVNTMIPNQIVYEAIRDKKIAGLDRFTKVKREVKFGDSRFDVFATDGKNDCYIEVKNASMKIGNQVLFPDAVTSRGLKHLNTLIEVKYQGMRAVMIYIVQRMDVNSFGIAKEIDPDYFHGLTKAMQNGVEVIVLQVKVNSIGIQIINYLPILL